MTTTTDMIRALELRIFKSVNDVFETITDFFVDGRDLDGEDWEREEPELNDVRDLCYRAKEELFLRLWPNMSFDQAKATGGITAIVPRAQPTQANDLRPFKVAMFQALHTAHAAITDFLLEGAGADNWEDFDPTLDGLRTVLMELETALFSEMWPNRTLKDVIAAGDLK